MTLSQDAPQVQRYLAEFAALERDGYARDPTWLRDLRRQAIDRFAEVGFPTERRGNEEWKYTDVRAIARRAFHRAAGVTPVHLAHADVEAHAFAGAQRNRLVFVNGRFAPEHSAVDALPPGTYLGRLSDALRTHSHLVSPHLARHAEMASDAFVALNTAFVQDGVFLHVAPGVTLPGPVQVLFLSTRPADESVSHPRLLAILGNDAHAVLIEAHVGLTKGRYFTNSVAELVLGPGSRLEHHKLQSEGSGSYHIATASVLQQRDSTYSALSLDGAGGLVRHNVRVSLAEPGARTSLRGLYLLDGKQHVDYHTFVDHAAPHTAGDELYKGVLSGAARVVFGGTMRVRQGAVGTRSRQTNQTLLLSEQAGVDTKPELEIYADDVQCSHGAAIGQLDAEALFYLRSRGLSEHAARSLLTYGFVSDVLHTVTHVPLRAYLDQLVLDALEDS